MNSNFRTYWKQLVDEAVTARKDKGLTPADLAELADVSKPTVIKFETGDMSMTVKKTLRILKALGLD